MYINLINNIINKSYTVTYNLMNIVFFMTDLLNFNLIK